MSEKQGNFQQFESFLSTLLLGDLGIFLLYLLFAAVGVGFLKIVLAILGIVLALFCLWILYRRKELLRSRSLWMTCGFASITLLIIVSLIFRVP